MMGQDEKMRMWKRLDAQDRIRSEDMKKMGIEWRNEDMKKMGIEWRNEDMKKMG